MQEKWQLFVRWVNGDLPPAQFSFAASPKRRKRSLRIESTEKTLRRFYLFSCGLICTVFTFALLYAVLSLPVFGEAGSPTDNMVSAYYIEKCAEETGALNLVAGMTLVYRAFDTLCELFVLFACMLCVIFLLKRDKSNFTQEEKRAIEIDDLFDSAVPNLILQTCGILIVPMILIFGIHLIANGHLSPGGGFSGGVALAGGLILYSLAYGPHRSRALFSYHVFQKLLFSGLFLCTLVKGVSILIDANAPAFSEIFAAHSSLISTAGMIVLNIGIGCMVLSIVYGCYAFFSRGGFE